jgi:hypothetical protein
MEQYVGDCLALALIMLSMLLGNNCGDVNRDERFSVRITDSRISHCEDCDVTSSFTTTGHVLPSNPSFPAR